MTPKHQRFVEEYLVDRNAAAAARRAGYAAQSARQTASRLLKRPEIAAEIRARTEAQSKRMEITRNRVLLEMARIAFADLGRVAEWGPAGLTLRASGVLDEHDRAGVAEVVPGREGAGARLRLHNKQRALEALMRHLGLYEYDPRQDARQTVAEMHAAAERARTFILDRLGGPGTAKRLEAEREAYRRQQYEEYAAHRDRIKAKEEAGKAEEQEEEADAAR